ncbi:glycerophosphodiester phosphodiesterase family protein [Shouchella clausii]|uniref:glycerophosphodiester phosphodiesterase n=1 Tax=Shouchella clausii TaxID=79880 RepID=UPI0031FD03A5
MDVQAIAHRGYSAKYPENTIAAYEASIDVGFSHIEVDVHLSRDEVPVIMHDKTVDRTTNGTGLIHAYTLKELRRLKTSGNERIPTLEEVLDMAKGRVKVAIELKQNENMYPRLEGKVAALIEEKGMANDVYVNSFNHESMGTLREIAPDLEIGLIKSDATPALFPYMEQIQASSIAMELRFYTEAFADQCKERGYQLIVWPVDTKEACKRMEKRPDVLCTVNELELFKENYRA